MSIVVILMMFGAVLLVVLPSSTMAQDNILLATRIQDEIVLDGVIHENGWTKAIPVSIEVERINNIAVETRALYDEQFIYMSFTWPDESWSVIPQQWQFIGGSWVSVPHKEDRLSILWNTEDSIIGFEQNKQACIVACHQEEFKTGDSQERGDLWQWMAGRTNPSTSVPDIGWMDDLSLTNTGIGADEFIGSAVWEENSLYAHDDNASTIQFSVSDVPKWKEGLNPPNPDPEANFLFRGFETPIVDHMDFEDGAKLPGYRLGRPAPTQDRADIMAKGVYDAEKKIWTVEIKRKLVTGNEGDVSFENLLNTYEFGLAIFDNQGGGVDTHYRSELVTLRFELPDLTVLTVDVDPTSLIIGNTVSVTTKVKNQGGYSAGFAVAIYLDDTSSEAVASKTFAEMTSGLEEEITITWDITGVAPGEHSLIIKADADDIIDEWDEENNLRVIEVWIYPDAPDLTIPEDGITFIPEVPRIGEAFTISVTVKNIGSNSSEATIVDVHLPMDFNRSIATAALLPMTVGESRTLDIPWPASETNPVDDFILGVRVDPENVVGEQNEINNELITLVELLVPKLEFLQVTSSHDEVEEGEEVTITVSVNATGDDPGLIAIIIDGGTGVGSRQGVTVPAGGGVSELFVIELEGIGYHTINATLYTGIVVAKDPAGDDLVEYVVVTVTEASVDSDGDGYDDKGDAFPDDPLEWADGDDDGHGDNGDVFPDDPLEWADADGDGVGDNADAFPDDPAASVDTDEDGHPDEWNTGKTKADSTEGLKLDHFPEDAKNWKEEEESPSLGLLAVITTIAFAAFITRKRRDLPPRSLSPIPRSPAL